MTYNVPEDTFKTMPNPTLQKWFLWAIDEYQRLATKERTPEEQILIEELHQSIKLAEAIYNTRK
ncbi:MAG TPA: hypothetical protein P5140_08095 [Methanofastidiosum sp.]|nr:hypothetical protein [Methanofastidiosum sp.]